jgi:hypothetical protein
MKYVRMRLSNEPYVILYTPPYAVRNSPDTSDASALSAQRPAVASVSIHVLLADVISAV